MTRYVPPLPALNLRARLACALAVQGAPHAIVQGTVDLGEYLDALRQATAHYRDEGNLDVVHGLEVAHDLLNEEAARC